MEEAEKAAKRSMLAKKLAGIAAIYCIEKVQQSILALSQLRGIFTATSSE